MEDDWIERAKALETTQASKFSDDAVKGCLLNVEKPTEWTDEKFASYVPANTVRVRRVENSAEMKQSVLIIFKFYGGHIVTKEELILAIYGVLANHSHADESTQGTAVPAAGTGTSAIDPQSLSFVGRRAATEVPVFPVGQENLSHAELENAYRAMVASALPPESSSDYQVAINLAAYLSLLIWRFSKKDAADVFVYIRGNSNKVFSSIFGHTEVPICLPSPKLPDMLKTCLPFEDANFKQLLGMVVNSYISTESSTLRGFYQASCLLTLGENGLGLISWTMKASLALGRNSLHSYLQYMGNGLTMKSLMLFLDWWEKDSKPKSWPFCRLFDSSAMADYSTKNNVEMCLIGAYIAMGVKDAVKKIPLMRQFDSTSNIRTVCRKIAEYCIKEITGARVMDAVTEKAQRMAAVVTLAAEEPNALILDDDDEEAAEAIDEGVEDDEDATSGVL